MRTGKHKGECIKNDIHRPILPLDERDVVKHVPDWQSAKPGDYALVANVSHIDPAQFDWSKPEESARQQFWFAKIPLGKVKDTYFQLTSPAFLPVPVRQAAPSRFERATLFGIESVSLSRI